MAMMAGIDPVELAKWQGAVTESITTLKKSVDGLDAIVATTEDINRLREDLKAWRDGFALSLDKSIDASLRAVDTVKADMKRELDTRFSDLNLVTVDKRVSDLEHWRVNMLTNVSKYSIAGAGSVSALIWLIYYIVTMATGNTPAVPPMPGVGG